MRFASLDLQKSHFPYIPTFATFLSIGDNLHEMLNPVSLEK